MCRKTNFENQEAITYRRRRCHGPSRLHRRYNNLPTIHDTDNSTPRTAAIEPIKKTTNLVEYSAPANTIHPISFKSENPPAYQEHAPPKVSQDSYFAIVHRLSETTTVHAENLGKHPGYITVFPLYSKLMNSALVVEMRRIQ
jgi:hypothetical protein